MAGVFYNFLYCTTVPCEEIICLQNRAFVVMVLMKRRFGNFKLFDIDCGRLPSDDSKQIQINLLNATHHYYYYYYYRYNFTRPTFV